MSKKRQKLVIDREIWLRGDDESSMLFNSSDGRSCCVGIYLEDCGVPDDVMDGIPDVAQLVAHVGDEILPKRAAWLLDEEGKDVAAKIDLYLHNDSDEIGEGEREEMVAERFAEYGVDVSFIN